MRSAQEFVHWLEMGAGARWLRLAAAVAVTLAMSSLIAWKQFHGPTSEATLEQAVIGRQLAEGHGFSTLVNYPQTAAVLRSRGVRFDPDKPYPDLYCPPLYPLMIAGGLRILPAATRAELFAMPAQLTDGFGADFFLLGLNLVLFWAAAWLTYQLGRELFDPRAGWVAALAVLASLSLWQQTLALNGSALLMVLALAAFLIWRRVERFAASGNAGNDDEAAPVPSWRGHVWIVALGLGCGLLFLTEYTAGALAGVALVYLAARFRGRVRWIALGGFVLGFAIVAGPWIARNLALTGNPVALAAQDVALKAGDTTAEPGVARATLSSELPVLSLRKLGNKTLTTLQETLNTKLWSSGAMWLTAFFVAGWLYSFRSAVANRLRWVFVGSFAVLLLAQAALNSGDTERPVVVWLAPLIIVFGTGFFFVLLGSNARLGQWPRVMATVLLAAQALPLLHDALAPPPPIRFQYPPYFPTLLRGMRAELRQRHAEGRFGAMADVPAGVAWYGELRTWAQPPRLRDFYAITLDQPIGELLLTPHTLDRPFFSELNATAVMPGDLRNVSNRFGEWGEIYAGLVTGTMPREFPLSIPHKVADNLFVLLNPGMPPPREK
ncbi:MAG TPA: hypothetical protein VHE61_13680 [Opitutaceae bacterium]|nr:hypothetical protein [Opitutaceae bacterium]